MCESRRNSARPAPARWPELRALLAWIAGSWRRPAGRAAAWEQAAGHERANSQPIVPPGQEADGQPDSRDAASGSKLSQSQ